MARVEVEEAAVRLAQADALAAQGHYLAFKKAVRGYSELFLERSLRAKAGPPLLKTTLLLAMREKQIGIDNPQTIRDAEALIRDNPSLSGYAHAAVLISALPLRTKGVMKDIDPDSYDRTRRERISAAEAELARASGTSEFSAAVLAAWNCSFGRYSEKWRDPADLRRTFPDSLLLKYEVAICGEEKEDVLEEILADDPGFAEARYHLGEAALGERQLFKAERRLLEAFQAIPESPQPRILLAGVYFATEEFEKGVQFFDLTLAVSPGYRDALLGKAICLSYLRKYEESMGVLNEILRLGYWLIGESHYWLALNLHELKKDADALGHIAEAKGRLPTNPHVWSLGGTIALEAGDHDRAEKDFTESLKYDPVNTESLFGLGTIHTRRTNWVLAGEYFEKAGTAYAAEKATLLAAVREIEASPLAEERKARLVQRKKSQIERVGFTEATSFYNAAAAYFNAGLKGKAELSAERALAHPEVKDKAEEILRSIRK
jgi:tetratricopeptide (TPR) repeat protein